MTYYVFALEDRKELNGCAVRIVGDDSSADGIQDVAVLLPSGVERLRVPSANIGRRAAEWQISAFFSSDDLTFQLVTCLWKQQVKELLSAHRDPDLIVFAAA